MGLGSLTLRPWRPPRGFLRILRSIRALIRRFPARFSHCHRPDYYTNHYMTLLKTKARMLLPLLWPVDYPRSSAGCLRCQCSQACRDRDPQHQNRVSGRGVRGVHRSRRKPIAPKPRRFKSSAVCAAVRRPIHARATTGADRFPSPHGTHPADDMRVPEPVSSSWSRFISSVAP
jgi:hypothetical protein